MKFRTTTMAINAILLFSLAQSSPESTESALTRLDKAEAQPLQGKTALPPIVVHDFEGHERYGRRRVDGVGDICWERIDRQQSTLSETAPVGLLEPRETCYFTPSSDKYTKGGRQIKASSTQVCNSPAGCSLTASITVTIGSTFSPSLPAAFFQVVSAAVGYTFESSKAYAVSGIYSQPPGTTGYMSYIPTLNCWDGRFNNCFETVGGERQEVDPHTLYTACTPDVDSKGVLDGTFSFVYVH